MEHEPTESLREGSVELESKKILYLKNLFNFFYVYRIAEGYYIAIKITLVQARKEAPFVVLKKKKKKNVTPAIINCASRLYSNLYVYHSHFAILANDTKGVGDVSNGARARENAEVEF